MGLIGFTMGLGRKFIGPKADFWPKTAFLALRGMMFGNFRKSTRGVGKKIYLIE